VAANLMGAPYGPSATFGRNFASLGALVLGAGCLVLPSLQGVPPSRTLIFGIVGAVLVGVFLFNCFRWKRVVRRAAKDARAVGAQSAAAFMQARRAPAKSVNSVYSAAGWLVILDDRILVRFYRSLSQGEANITHCEIPFHDVASVSRTDTTSISYAALVLVVSTGEEWVFTLAPQSGSGWRGSSEEETDNVIRHIAERINAQE
jgi:hypothetical protein